MLTLVITQKRVFISAQNQLLLTLSPNSSSQSPLSSDTSLAEILEARLPEIKSLYWDRNATGREDPNATIPVAVSIPFDPLGSEVGQKLLDVFQTAEDNGFSLVFTDNLATSFLYGISPDNGLVSGACMVLEGLEDYVNIYYHNLSVGDTDLNPQTLTSLGKLPGKHELYNRVVEQVRQGGIELDKTEQENFHTWLLNEYEGHSLSYSFSHRLQTTEIQFQVEVPADACEAAMLAHCQVLEPYLNSEFLTAKKIYKVVLLGEYLKKPLLQKYLVEELGIESKIQVAPPLNTEVQTLTQGLTYRARHFLETKLQQEQAEERKSKVKEAKQLTQKLNLEIEQFESRERFFATLSTLHIDPEQETALIEKFVEEGKDLNLPETIIRWKVKEAVTKNRIRMLKEQSLVLEAELNRLAVEDQASLPAMTSSKPVDISYTEMLEVVEPIVPFVEEESVVVASDSSETVVSEPAGAIEVEAVDEVQVEEDLDQAEEVFPPAEVEMEGAPEPVSPVSPLPTPQPVPQVQTAGVGANVLVKALPTEVEPQVKAIVKSAPTLPQVGIVDTPTPEKRIRDLFRIKQFLPIPDFQAMIVQPAYSKKPQILKLITFQQLEDSMLHESFMAVHHKEASYYEHVSEIQVAREGKYYVRKAMEGVPLRVYARKSGLDRKVDIERFTPHDNLLMLEVIRSVLSLDVPHPNLNEDNTLIQVKRSWNLEKSVKVSLSGFTPQTGTLDENVQLMNYMFERLLRPGVYEAFCQKHEI